MKTDIEYAAMVIGPSNIAHHAECVEHYAQRDGSDDCDCFQPLLDDGDSRRLEIECLDWSGKYTEEFCIAWDALQDIREYGEATPEQYREAVFALAVAIGKMMEGNDNAG